MGFGLFPPTSPFLRGFSLSSFLRAFLFWLYIHSIGGRRFFFLYVPRLSFFPKKLFGFFPLLIWFQPLFSFDVFRPRGRASQNRWFAPFLLFVRLGTQDSSFPLSRGPLMTLPPPEDFSLFKLETSLPPPSPTPFLAILFCWRGTRTIVPSFFPSLAFVDVFFSFFFWVLGRQIFFPLSF